MQTTFWCSLSQLLLRSTDVSVYKRNSSWTCVSECSLCTLCTINPAIETHCKNLHFIRSLCLWGVLFFLKQVKNLLVQWDYFNHFKYKSIYFRDFCRREKFFWWLLLHWSHSPQFATCVRVRHAVYWVPLHPPLCSLTLCLPQYAVMSK